MKLFQSLLVVVINGEEAHDMDNDGHGSDVPFGRVVSRDQIESMARVLSNEIEPIVAQQAIINRQYGQAAIDIYQPSRIQAANVAQAQLNQQWGEAHRRERQFYQSQYAPDPAVSYPSHFQQQSSAYLNQNSLTPAQSRADGYYHQEQSLNNQISNLRYQDQQAVSDQNNLLAQKLEEKLSILQQVQKEVKEQQAILQKIITQKQQEAANTIASKRPFAEEDSTASGKYQFEEPEVLPRYPINVRKNSRDQHQSTSISNNTVEIIQLADENDPKDCFVENASINSGIFNANSIDLIENVYTSKGCQSHCKLHAQQGCKYFVWNSEDHSCELFSSLDGLEYDENGISFVGMAEGCFECEKPGFDFTSYYSSDSLTGRRAVYEVPDVFTCLEICKNVDGCEFVSFRVDNRCYLKDSSAPENIEDDEDYTSAPVQCVSEFCLMKNKEFEQGWFSNSDIITWGSADPIPGVQSASNCSKICDIIPSCRSWSFITEAKSCSLLKSLTALHFTEGVISGTDYCQ
ncbi:unnamed protein product [Oikopleura dioica]|uniref:Apple domain-containing protein n=1 Tax=Oikopleura dioica TaxID=34765 RepID=E4XPL0_OIKDI|nr:unnamed protein product [Oikopleura dioica]